MSFLVSKVRMGITYFDVIHLFFSFTISVRNRGQFSVILWILRNPSGLFEFTLYKLMYSQRTCNANGIYQVLFVTDMNNNSPSAIFPFQQRNHTN